MIWKKVNTGDWKSIKTWERIEDPEMVQSYLTHCMVRHFNQAHGTPLTTDKWKKQLQNRKFLEEIREGNFESLVYEDASIRKYFEAMYEDRSDMKKIPATYTLAQWTENIQNAKESTSTSPSGRHYGHHKTILKYRPDIFKWMHELASLAMENGIVLERWRKTITVLIEKHPGQPYIHRTRPLHLVEPEVNAVAKMFWARNLMQEAEREKKVTINQYGGRKNHQPISAVLNKIMYYNINAQLLKEAEYDNDDLRSNYDREMVDLVLAEAEIKHGMHPENTAFVRQFVKNQKFYIKTGLGISETPYTNTNEFPIYGMGQGIAWSGPAWIMASNTIAKSKKKTCVGFRFIDPLTGLKVEKLEDFFVDDTAEGCNATEGGKTIMQQASHNLQEHVNLVNVTGGDIALDKCDFYHIQFRFEEGEAVCVAMVEQDSELVIIDPNTKKPIKIQQMDCDEEHMTLGCYVNPIGVNRKAVKQLVTYAKEWRNNVETSKLPSQYVLYSYESMLKMRLRYRLPAYSMTFDQCEEVMKIVRPTILHSMHLHRNFAKNIMETGDRHMGMKIYHLYDMMGMEKLRFMFMHIRRNDVTGRMMLILIKHMQIECGSGTPFFHLDYNTWGNFATWNWITHLWEYLDSRAIQLDLTERVVYELPRENDVFVMDIVQKLDIPMEDKIKINKVRQHMKVLSLADIVDGRGKKLLNGVQNAELIGRCSTLEFKPQAPPSKWIKIWKEKVIPAITRHLSRFPLGRWVAPTHQKWKWKISKDSLWIKCGNKYFRAQEYKRRNSHNGVLYMLHEHEVENERDAIDIDENRRVDILKTRKGYKVLYEEKVPLLHGNLTGAQGAVMTKDQHALMQRNIMLYKRLWGKVDFAPNMNLQKIYEFLMNGEVFGGSDGSVNLERCGHAWGLRHINFDQVIVKGRGPVHNSPEDANSTRAEMFAVLNVISFVGWIYHEKHSGKNKDLPIFVVYTDSQSTILNSGKEFFPTTKTSFENDIDVKMQLRELLDEVPMKVKFCHVKSHQDAVTPVEELSIDAKMNVDMDEHVNRYFSEKILNPPHKTMAEFLPAQKISARLPFERPSSDIEERLIGFKSGHDAENTMCNIWKIEKSDLCLLDWECLIAARKKLPKYEKYSMSKAIFEQWHTMNVAKRNGVSDSSVCPLCEECEDSWAHVFSCSCDVVKVERRKNLEVLKTAMTEMKTEPILQRRLLNIISQFTNGFPITTYANVNGEPLINQTFRDLNKIGYHNLLKGLIPYSMRHVQRDYLRKMDIQDRKYGADRWAIKLIDALQDFMQKTWKFRCSRLGEKKNGLMENRLRLKSIELLGKIRANKWLLLNKDMALRERSEEYFLKAPVRNVKNWMLRVEYGLLDAEQSRSKKQEDIRKFFVPLSFCSTL